MRSTSKLTPMLTKKEPHCVRITSPLIEATVTVTTASQNQRQSYASRDLAVLTLAHKLRLHGYTKVSPNSATLVQKDAAPRSTEWLPSASCYFETSRIDGNMQNLENLTYISQILLRYVKPLLLSDTSFSCHSTNHSAVCLTVANKRGAKTCQRITCVHSYVSGLWVRPRHRNTQYEVGSGCFWQAVIKLPSPH